MMQRLVFVSLLLIGFEGWCMAEDQCADVLRDGIRDTTQSASNSSLNDSVKNWLCTHSESQIQNGTNFGLGISIPDTPVGGSLSFGNSSLSAWKAQNCGSNSHALDQNAAQSIALQIASSTVVEAWRDCMRHRSPGFLQGDLHANGDDLVFTVRFNPIATLPPPKVTGFFATGATCAPAQLQRGTVVSVEGIAQPCHRLNAGPVTIVLNTDRGPITEMLAARVALAQADQNNLPCVEGDTECVHRMMAIYTESCAGNLACLQQVQCREDRFIARWQLARIKRDCKSHVPGACAFLPRFQASLRGRTAMEPIEAPCAMGGGPF